MRRTHGSGSACLWRTGGVGVVPVADNAAGVPLQGDPFAWFVPALLLVAWWALSAVRRPVGGRW